MACFCAKGIAWPQVGNLPVVASDVQGSTTGKELSRPTSTPTSLGSLGVSTLSFNIMDKYTAICLRKGPGKRVSIFVAPCALRYIFAAFVVLVVKDGHALGLIKAAIGW